MSDFFDSQDFEFNCPQCKRAVRTRVANLKRSNYKCPYCRAKFDTSGFKRGLDEADRQIDLLQRQIGNIKIDIKL